MNEKIKQYFEQNGFCLNVKAIEAKAEIPRKTLEHFLSGRRGLPPEAAEKIVKVLQSLHYEN